jgi:formylmethanofuran dehydrogenase subunit E
MTYLCRQCGDDIPEGRYLLGKRICLLCGEEAAREERMSWCIVQEYGKGAYTLVTPEAAKVTLKQTNQKNLRA